MISISEDMIEFACTPLHVRIALSATMVTMQFRKAQMCLFFINIVFSFMRSQETILQQCKIVMGCKVGQIRFCAIGYPISVLF